MAQETVMAPATIGQSSRKDETKVGGATRAKNSAARRLRQIPAGYLIVGIDLHKSKHAAVALTEDLMVRTRFKFGNSKVGFEQALENARVEMFKCGCRGVVFAIETGRHFWRNFAYCVAPGNRLTPSMSSRLDTRVS